MIRKALMLTIPMALSACASVGDDAQADRLASAKLVFANGQAAGTAELTGAGSKVSLVIALAGVTPGPHGIHLHAVGRCEAPAFTTAGGHLNPGSKQHGTDNPMGSHAGDLPNLMVDTLGMARARLRHKLRSLSLANVALHLGLGVKGKTIHNVRGMTRAAINSTCIICR